MPVASLASPFQLNRSRAPSLRALSNPQPKRLPRTPRIPEPWPVFQLRVRVSRRHAGLLHDSSFFAALQVAGPCAPLDWFEVWAGENDAYAEEEDGEESFECDVDGEAEFAGGVCFVGEAERGCCARGGRAC